MNIKLKKILTRIRNGEKWLAFPTIEYLHQLFQPNAFIRQYIGFDTIDNNLINLQKKWKFLNLKETYTKTHKKEKNIEKIKIWIQDHPTEDVLSYGISKKIHFDLNIPTSTIRQLLHFMIKNNYVEIKKTDIYTKLFASDLPISLSERKNARK